VVARELACLHGDKIVLTSGNPGNLNTDLQRHIPKWQYAMAVCLLVSRHMMLIPPLGPLEPEA
jgi:hypothetical protein